MKERIFLCLAALLFSLTAHSQTSEAPDGAAGVKFGMTPTEVKAIWKTKGTIYQDYESIKSTVGSLAYNNISVGSEKFDIVIAKFVNNKLFEIALVKRPDKDAFAQAIYDNLQTIINNKYMKGKSYRVFTGIYDDGDGYEMQAVRVGDGKIMTFWNFDPNSIISLQIIPFGNTVAVELGYQNLKLFEEVEKIMNKVNNDEF